MTAGELRELLRDLPEAADRVLGEAAVGALDLDLLPLVRQVEIDDEERLEVVVVLRDFDAGRRIVVIDLHREVRVRIRSDGLPDGPEDVPADDPHEIVRVEVLHGHDVRGLDNDLRRRLGHELRGDDVVVPLLPPPHDDCRNDDVEHDGRNDSNEQLHGWLLSCRASMPELAYNTRFLSPGQTTAAGSDATAPVSRPGVGVGTGAGAGATGGATGKIRPHPASRA